MADWERKAINASQSRSGTTVHGIAAVIFGVPFLGAGAFIVLASYDFFHVDPSSFHAPRWVVAAAGGLFGLVGLWLMLHGIAGMRREARRKAQLARRPGEPWLADHAWDARGSRDNNLGRAIGATLGFSFVCLLAVPFVWVMFKADGVPLFAKFIMSFFVLVFAIFGGYMLYLWMRFLKYGTSRIEFGEFPAYLGEKLAVRYKRLRPLDAQKITFTLRCVEEKYETTGSGDNRSTSVQCYQLYGDVIVREIGALERRRGLDLELEFALPPNPELTTHLAVRPPTYWELEASAETPGVDYAATFLVPVYSRPAS